MKVTVKNDNCGSPTIYLEPRKHRALADRIVEELAKQNINVVKETDTTIELQQVLDTMSVKELRGAYNTARIFAREVA